MGERFRIMEASEDHLTAPIRYFIDCPVDVEMHHPEVRRIEIPRELAYFLRSVQSENSRLKEELLKLKRDRCMLR